ncbi:MAG: hypothetical protein LBG71_03480 [Clostridiales Family XIII bacterium]|nr:hypothetical protein [Clostridiales Family XIII bacterium]
MTSAYYAATTQAEKNAIHNQAQAIRDNPANKAAGAVSSGGSSSGGSPSSAVKYSAAIVATAAQLQTIANLYNAVYDSKVGYVTEKQWNSVLKGAEVVTEVSGRTSFATAASKTVGPMASTALKSEGGAAGILMPDNVFGVLRSHGYTVTMQFKNSNVVVIGGSKYYDG